MRKRRQTGTASNQLVGLDSRATTTGMLPPLYVGPQCAVWIASAYASPVRRRFTRRSPAVVAA